MSKLTDWLDTDHDGKPELPADLERLLCGFGKAALAILGQYIAAELAKIIHHANPGDVPTPKDSTQPEPATP